MDADTLRNQHQGSGKEGSETELAAATQLMRAGSRIQLAGDAIPVVEDMVRGTALERPVRGRAGSLAEVVDSSAGCRCSCEDRSLVAASMRRTQRMGHRMGRPDRGRKETG